MGRTKQRATETLQPCAVGKLRTSGIVDFKSREGLNKEAEGTG